MKQSDVICKLSYIHGKRELCEIFVIPLPVMKRFARFLLERESTDTFKYTLEDGTEIDVPYENLEVKTFDEQRLINAYKTIMQSDIGIHNDNLMDAIQFATNQSFKLDFI